MCLISAPTYRTVQSHDEVNVLPLSCDLIRNPRNKSCDKTSKFDLTQDIQAVRPHAAFLALTHSLETGYQVAKPVRSGK